MGTGWAGNLDCAAGLEIAFVIRRDQYASASRADASCCAVARCTVPRCIEARDLRTALRHPRAMQFRLGAISRIT